VRGDAEAGVAGAHDHRERREQELRHDRLADGVVHRPRGGGEGDGHHPEPGDELPIERQPGGADRGAGRAAGVRR
jgi:hypothetical protein